VANFRVVPKLSYANSSLVTGDARKNLKVPVGVAAYDPIPVSTAKMYRLRSARLVPPAGLTTATAEVEVPGALMVTTGKAGQWKFPGGDIILKVEIAVYIDDRYAKIPALFKLIMEHEYLHVRDYQNLAKSNFAKLIGKDETLEPWLAGECWTGRDFYDGLEQVWGDEAERLGDILDSGPDYERQGRVIVKLAGGR
jgi:hypothetical protein